MTTTTRVRDRLDPLRKLRRRLVDGAGAGEERGERPALRPRGPVERVARREELASRRHALPRREFRRDPARAGVLRRHDDEVVVCRRRRRRRVRRRENPVVDVVIDDLRPRLREHARDVARLLAAPSTPDLRELPVPRARAWGGTPLRDDAGLAADAARVGGPAAAAAAAGRAGRRAADASPREPRRAQAAAGPQHVRLRRHVGQRGVGRQQAGDSVGVFFRGRLLAAASTTPRQALRAPRVDEERAHAEHRKRHRAQSQHADPCAGRRSGVRHCA